MQMTTRQRVCRHTERDRSACAGSARSDTTNGAQTKNNARKNPSWGNQFLSRVTLFHK